MATVQNKQTTTATTIKSKASTKDAGTLFTKKNHKLMAIGGGIISLGFILMLGGKSADANNFNTNDVYSFIRITLAPILILAGLVTLVYAILKKG